MKLQLNTFLFTFRMKSKECRKSRSTIIYDCLDIVSDPENKATMLITSSFIRQIEDAKYRSGISSITILNENFKVSYISMMFPLYSPYFEEFNMKIHQMIDSGFIDHWIDKDLKTRSLIRKEEDIGPQVLTMEHLEVAFYACLIPLAASIVVFLVELCINVFR